MPNSKTNQIIEIGFDIPSAEEYEFLEKLLVRCGFKFYVAPKNNYASLEDLECQCEGK